MTWLIMMAFMSLGCADDETTYTPPVVFECDMVDTGQSLTGTAKVTGSDIEVRITSDNGRFTEAPAIVDVSGGTLGDVTVDMGVVQVPLAAVGASASFTLGGRLTGPKGDFCEIQRAFTVSTNADGATVE